MANIDYNIKLESLPFENFRKTGDLSKSLSSVLPASAEQPQNFMDAALQAFGKYKITPDQSTLSNLIVSQAFLGPKTPGFNEKGGLREQLDYASQKNREEADYAQKLGKESVWEAAKAKMILDLPGKLANAFNPYGSPQGALAYAAQLNNLPNVANDTMRSIPMMNVQSIPYNQPQQKYFA